MIKYFYCGAPDTKWKLDYTDDFRAYLNKFEDLFTEYEIRKMMVTLGIMTEGEAFGIRDNLNIVEE